jgi:hypothetical protein
MVRWKVAPNRLAVGPAEQDERYKGPRSAQADAALLELPQSARERGRRSVRDAEVTQLEPFGPMVPSAELSDRIEERRRRRQARRAEIDL